MGSAPVFDQFPAGGKTPSALASQSFPGFQESAARTPASRSQTTRATNCANPGFLGIQFCFNCGQTCGHGDFLTTSACGGSACIVGVSRDCGHGIFWLERGASCTQIKRDTNFATPGYSLSCHDTTARGKNKVFSVCGHLCGQSRFCAVFGNRRKTRYRPCRKALRAFVQAAHG